MLTDELNMIDEMMAFIDEKLKRYPKLLQLPAFSHTSYEGIMLSLDQSRIAGRFLTDSHRKIYDCAKGIYDISLILDGRDPDTANAEGQ